ncbi:MAG: glycosyltransferase family 4 protein [Desulfobacteraceae bacterium]|nr:glycosyltransferase family 4 protein [Desulfobacteraceae bacterium]
MKKQYTVSILGTLPPIRALSSYCFEFANAIAEKCRVEFISFKKIYPSFLYPGGAPDDDNTYPAVSTTQINIRRRISWYNPLSWIIEGLTAKGNLLHAQWWSGPLFPVYFFVCACFKIKKKPVIFTVHNVLSHENAFLYFKMSQFLFKFGDHFIVHSNINKQQLTEFYKIVCDKISVIPHGSLDFHIKKGVNRKKIRKEMGIDPESKVILLFGAIRPYKGIDTAIKAFAEIIKNVPKARLLIAGRLWEDWTPYAQLIEKLGINKNIITYLDYIPSGDVYKFFEASDLCVFPYHHFDSQSGAGSVAISFRKPMIVSKVGGLPDLVKDPNWVVPPGDPSALARAVIICLGNPNMIEQMKSEAETISYKFSWSEIADKTEKIYQQLLNQKC